MKQRADYIVDRAARVSGAARSGLVCAFPDGAAQLENAVAGRPFVGVPWYTMHKIFARPARRAPLRRQRAGARGLDEARGRGRPPSTAPMTRRAVPAHARHRARRHERGARGRRGADRRPEVPRRSPAASATRRCSRRSPKGATRSTDCTPTRRSRKSSVSSGSSTLTATSAIAAPRASSGRRSSTDDRS